MDDQYDNRLTAVFPPICSFGQEKKCINPMNRCGRYYDNTCPFYFRPPVIKGTDSYECLVFDGKSIFNCSHREYEDMKKEREAIKKGYEDLDKKSPLFIVAQAGVMTNNFMMFSEEAIRSAVENARKGK